MPQGSNGGGKQISVFLEGSKGLAHPSHSTGTTTSERTNMLTPRTDEDDNMDDIRMCQHRLQRQRLDNAQADHEAANTTKHQPNGCRNHIRTANGPHSGRRT